MEKKVAEEQFYGENIGTFEHLQCKCGEKVYSLETVAKMEEVAKSKGVWGLAGNTTFSKWGKSIGIRIPSKIISLLKIRSGEAAEVIPNLKAREIMIKV